MFTRALNKLGDQPEISALLQDSFEILAHASMECNDKRRTDLKPHMQGAKHLVSRNIPVTTELFGDNLDQEFKKLEQDKKLRESMSAGPSGSQHKALGRARRGGASSFTHRGVNKPYYHNNKVERFRERAKNFLGHRAGKDPARSKKHNKFRDPYTKRQ